MTIEIEGEVLDFREESSEQSILRKWTWTRSMFVDENYSLSNKAQRVSVIKKLLDRRYFLRDTCT